MTHSSLAIFVSDVHLSEQKPLTAQAFLCFLTEVAGQAEHLYLLGDIFDSWPGDDHLHNLIHHPVLQALKAIASSNTQVYWMAGNRDFLVGSEFAQLTQVQLIDDPSVIHLTAQPIILTHGDACCTDDIAYMKFRAQVRNPQFQKKFLALPLQQRQRMIQEMRAQSQMAQQQKTDEIMDVNESAIQALFDQSDARIMIHGHTHRPGLHQANGYRRYVLSDWEYDLENKEKWRGNWITLSHAGDLTTDRLGF